MSLYASTHATPLSCRVVIDSGITIKNPPSALVAALRARLTLPNPKHVAASKRGKRPPYNVSPVICAVTENADEVRIPRGAMSLLRECARNLMIRLDFADSRVCPAVGLEVSSKLSLRDYQELAVTELCKRHQGVVIGPCGSGKTCIGIGAIASLDTPTIVIVASVDLAEQWRSQIVKLLDAEPGLIGDGVRNVRPITIALVQSLSRLNESERSTLLARFGLLIVDECHHAPAETFAETIDSCPAKYRLALTATPEREDGLTPMIGWYFGDTLKHIRHEALIASGALVAAEIRQLPTQYTYQYRGQDDWTPMLSHLVNDAGRNALIVTAVAQEARDGNAVLVLTGRVEHCNLIASALTNQGINAAALTGNVPKRRRTQILEDARNGSLQVVVATSLADEGLDLPRLSRVYLVYPSRAAGRNEQRLGRVMRPHPDKTSAALVDLVDVKVDVLRYQARKRAETFRRVLGLRSKVAA